MATRRLSPSRAPSPAGRVTCPKCRSRLEVFETPSGAKTVSVLALGPPVESHAKALERFIAPESGPDITCPACELRIDPAAPYLSRLTDQPFGRAKLPRE
jgi:DNA-directed RNA polymerase subunit RPC12/RpoP